MEDKNWSYSTTDEMGSPVQQSLGSSLGRLGAAAVKGTWGIPGMLADLPVSFGNLVYETATGKQAPFASNVVSEALNLPSPSSVGTLLENIAEHHQIGTPEERKAFFKPATGLQGLVESATENLPSFLLGGGGLARTAVKSLGASAAQKGVELLRPVTGQFGPLLENVGFMAAAHVLHPGISPKNIETKIAPAYAAFEEKAPSSSLGIDKTKTVLESVDKRLRPTFEDAKPLRDKLNQIESMYTKIQGQPEKLTFEEAKNIMQDLNEFSSKLTPTGQHYVSEIKKGIEADMHAADPALYKDFTNARDLYKAWNKYKDATTFITSNDLVSKTLAKFGIGNVLGALSPVSLGRLIKESDLAKKYYTDLMTQAVKQNVGGVVSNIRKIEKLIEKQKPEVISVTKNPDKEGWVYESI